MSEERSTTTVNSAEIARLAGVGRAAVSNWRRRYGDFPQPVGGTETSPSFDLDEVREWLREQGKLAQGITIEAAWQLLNAVRDRLDTTDSLAFAGAALLVAASTEDTDVESLSNEELDARIHQAFADGHEPAVTLPSVDAFREVLTSLTRLAREHGDSRATFERLYQRYLTSVSRQFPATPPDLAELMAGLINTSGGTVLDPACGSGSLLRAALLADEEVRLLGQESVASLVRLTRIRLRLHGADPDIRVGDSLRDDAFSGRPADAVVLNPPFNQRGWGHEELSYDARWEYGLPAKGDSELAWVQHALAGARPGAPVVMLMPPGVASRRSGRRVRAELLRRGALRAVVALPAGMAPPMGIPLTLWVLRRPAGQETGPPDVLLVDVNRPEITGAHDSERTLWPDITARVLDAYRAFTKDPATVADVSDCAAVVSVVDLLDEDVDVTPSRYVQRAEHGLADLEQAHTSLTAATGELPRLFPEVRPGPVTLQAVVTVSDLVRRGGLELYSRSRTRAAESEDTAGGDVALTGVDIARGDEPSGRVSQDEAEQVWLRPGDVVVPRVVTQPVARVITDERAVLHSSVYLLRPDPDVLDPWFLAGFLSSSNVLRFSSGVMRSHTRVDIRRVELPRLPLAEQRVYGATFQALDRFHTALRQATVSGEELWRSTVDGLAAGSLRPVSSDGE